MMDHEKNDISLLTTPSDSPPSYETFQKLDALEALNLEKESAVADAPQSGEASDPEEAEVQ